MITGYDFQRIAGIAIVALLPATMRAGGFDGFVVPEGSEQIGDSVLVGEAFATPDTVAATDVDRPAPEENAAYSDHDWSGNSPSSGSSRSQHSFRRMFGDVDQRWSAEVDLLMLWQNNLQSRPLFINAANGRTALDADQAQTPMALGPRVGLTLSVDPARAIEGNYFQAGFFEGEAVTPPGQYAESNLAGNFFSPVDQAGFGTQGFVQSAEMNWRHRSTKPLSWIAGFRWVEWNQDMAIVEVTQGLPSAAYLSRAGNDLYGGQLGLDACLWNEPKGRVKINTVGKAGVFYNNAYQRLEYIDQNGLVELAADAGDTSFFGEITATMTVGLTKYLSWRAGYSLFWLGGVATPAQQFSKANVDVNNPPVRATVDMNGSVLLNGATTGLEARW